MGLTRGCVWCLASSLHAQLIGSWLIFSRLAMEDQMAYFQGCWTIPLTNPTLSSWTKPLFSDNFTWKHDLVSDMSDWLWLYCLLCGNGYITFNKLLCSSEEILRKPEELALLINSDTSFLFFFFFFGARSSSVSVLLIIQSASSVVSSLWSTTAKRDLHGFVL